MWPIPASFLVVSLGAVVLAGAVVAFMNRRRRLARFGDAAVLGVARRRCSSIAAPVLTSAAACFIAAAVLLQGGAQQVPSEKTAALEIVIDMQSVRNLANAAGIVSDAVRTAIEGSPPCRVAVYLAGDPPQLVIPPTVDAQGALMLINELVVGGTPARPRFRRGGPASHVVYVTSKAPEDIENECRGARAGSSVAFVVPAASGDLRFGTRGPDGVWTWSSSPIELHQFLAAEEAEKPGLGLWLRSLSDIQWMALLGFFLLAAECLWNRP